MKKNGSIVCKETNAFIDKCSLNDKHIYISITKETQQLMNHLHYLSAPLMLHIEKSLFVSAMENVTNFFKCKHVIRMDHLETSELISSDPPCGPVRSDGVRPKFC